MRTLRSLTLPTVLAALALSMMVPACAAAPGEEEEVASDESNLDETRATWRLTGPLRFGHGDPTAVRLDDGRVFVATGVGSAELYDPVTSQWVRAAAETGGSSGRRGVAAKLPDGEVLMVRDSSTIAWRYDAKNDIWRNAGTPLVSHREHTITWLPSVHRFLIVGEDPSSKAPQSELFDPSAAAAMAFSRPAPMINTRFMHTATLLPSGKVLVTGGVSGGAITQTCEIYDPVTNTWAPARSMNKARVKHSATLLPDGRVLVAGSEAGTPYGGLPKLWGGGGTSAEIFDPAANVWTEAAPMPVASTQHAATLLDDGRVLLVGGNPERRTRIYDPKSNAWIFGPALTDRRWDAALVDMKDGTYLAVGGVYMTFLNGNPGDVGQQLSRQSAERLAAEGAASGKGNGAQCTVSSECGSGFCVDGVCCESACGGGQVDCQACSVAAGGAENGKCTTAKAGTTCRASRGGCDAAESCDGASTACPADVVSAQGTQCRASNGVCDLPEVCTGVFPYCPDDGFKPNGSACQTGTSEAGFCSVGACKPQSQWPTP